MSLEDEANLVMVEIACLTEESLIYGTTTASAMLKHLYELHRLRDEEVRQDVLTILDYEGHFDTFNHVAEL